MEGESRSESKRALSGGHIHAYSVRLNCAAQRTDRGEGRAHAATRSRCRTTTQLRLSTHTPGGMAQQTRDEKRGCGGNDSRAARVA
jgi:hypothetical protein